MVAAKHDRQRPGCRDLRHLATDHLVGAGQVGRHDGGIAGVHHVEPPERLDAELQRVDVAGVVRGLAVGARSEASARAVADCVVERGPEDGHVSRPLAESGGIGHQGKLLEGRNADVRRQIELVELGVGIRADWRMLVVRAAVAANLLGHDGAAASIRAVAGAVAARSWPGCGAARCYHRRAHELRPTQLYA